MTPDQVNEIITDAQLAQQISRLALAYAHAQATTSGDPNLQISPIQWTACWAVAQRFLKDPSAMTAELCHHEWRLTNMHALPPMYRSQSMYCDWVKLSSTDQMIERMGLRAMQDEYAQMRQEEEEALTEHLHPDAQQTYDAENFGAGYANKCIER